MSKNFNLSQDGFTKKHTLICKGIALLLMYFHHLFYNQSVFEGFNIIWTPISEETAVWIAAKCKVCVAIFVFLSGYGYAKKYKDIKTIKLKNAVASYLKLMIGFWIIYILAFSISVFSDRTPIDVYGGYGLKFIAKVIIDFMGMSYIFSTATLNGTWWYMSLAIIFIFISPIIIWMINKRKYTGVMVAVILFALAFLPLQYKWRSILFYSFTLTIGIMCSKYELFERLNKNITMEVTTTCVMALAIVISRKFSLFWLWDTVFSVIVCYLIYKAYFIFKPLEKVLYTIGKYSMNGFLIHSFIYYYYFREEIYSIKFFLGIWVILTCITLVLSYLIERIKKIIGYNKVITKLKRLQS